MKIGQPINQLSASVLRGLLPSYRKYTDFNRLGFFRGLCESQKLTLEEKEELRDLGKTIFAKYYDFLVVKDPHTWDRLENLGNDRTQQEITADWKKINERQYVILKNKEFGHRNFGIHSRHDCCYENCKLNNAMTKPKYSISFGLEIWFDQDANKYGKKERALLRKKEKRQRRWLKEDSWG